MLVPMLVLGAWCPSDLPLSPLLPAFPRPLFRKIEQLQLYLPIRIGCIVAATAALAPCTSQTDNAAELQQRLAEGSCVIDDGAEWQRRLDEESCVIDDVVEWQQRLDAGGSGEVLHDPSLDAEESYLL